MRRVNYEDGDGRWHAVLLPDDVEDADASMGIPIGPPCLDDLGLPTELHTRLHNELYVRDLLTAKAVRSRRNEVFAAIIAALRVDAETLMALY